MKKILFFALCVFATPLLAFAGTAEGDFLHSGNTNTTPDANAYGQVVRPLKSYEDGGERTVEGYTNVESHWTNLPTGTTSAMFSADIAIKNSNGFVKDITCYSDAAATAGTIALRDSTVAGAGDTLWSFDVLAVAYNTPFTVALEVPFSVGLYADFTTTADVKCMVRYR